MTAQHEGRSWCRATARTVRFGRLVWLDFLVDLVWQKFKKAGMVIKHLSLALPRQNGGGANRKICFCNNSFGFFVIGSSASPNSSKEIQDNQPFITHSKKGNGKHIEWPFTGDFGKRRNLHRLTSRFDWGTGNQIEWAGLAATKRLSLGNDSFIHNAGS